MKRLLAFGLSLGLVAAVAAPAAANVSTDTINGHVIKYLPNGMAQQWFENYNATAWYHDVLKPTDAFEPFDPAECDSTFTWTVANNPFWLPFFEADAYYVCRTNIDMEAYLAKLP